MAQTKAQRRINLKRKEQGNKAIKKIKDYLTSIGINVTGIKHKTLIKVYADKKGLTIPHNVNRKTWAIENVLGIKPIKNPTKKSARRTVKEVAEEFAEENRKMPTPAEKYFKKLLKLSGFRFKTEKTIEKPPTFILVDFYIPDRSLCIELDGGYHDTPEQKAKDCERDAYLAARGYNNWRMTNEEALALTKDDVIAKIESFTPRQWRIKIIPYEEPRYGNPKKPKKWGNPRPAKKRTKMKRKPSRPGLPSPQDIAANKARREALNRKVTGL